MTSSENVVKTYTYYLDGNQATKTEQSNGIAKLTAYTYDGLGRLLEEQEIRNGVITTIGYTYDRQNNRAAMAVTGAESSTTSYAYDANNRLTEEEKTDSEGTTTVAYTYDPNGNQLTRGTALPTATGGDETFVHTHGTGAETLEVNTYDGFNRLTAVNNDQGNVYFTYNPNGLRYTKNTDENSLIHIWDGQNLVADLTDEGVVASYVRALNLIASDTATGRKYYLYNAHGDVVQLSDTDGLVLWYYEYDAFGVERDPHPSDTNPFRYCGEYFDKETGAIYLRARYYNPAIGRFVTADTHWNSGNVIYGDSPIKINEGKDSLGLNIYLPDMNAIMQSGNLYAYGLNNPIMFRDPSGEIVITTTVLLIAAGAVIFGTAGGFVGNGIANKKGATGWSKVGYIAGGATIGAVAGGALGAVAGPIVTSITGIAGVSITASGITTVAATGATVAPALQKLFDSSAGHIFSTAHMKDGLMKLGSSQVDIFNKVTNIANKYSGQWASGSNEIRTVINGTNTTIRFFVQNGKMIKIDAFVGYSERVIGNLIK